MTRLLFCCLLLLLGAVTAQEMEPTPDPMAVAADVPAHNEIQVLKQHIEDSLNARDIDSVLYGLAKDVVFSTLNGEVVRGKENVKSHFQNLVADPQAPVKEYVIDLHVQDSAIVYNEDELSDIPRFAIAYGSSDLKYTLASGETFQVQPGWTATVMRDQDSWKIVNFHIAIDMYDNPVLEKVKQRTLLTGAICLIVGLLLGYLGGKARP